MRKHIERLLLLLLPALAFTACTEDEGTEPGNDSKPVATVYEYTAGEGYNPDNDCLFRVATNSATKDIYYLAELTTAKDARNMTDDQYAQYVEQNGVKIDVNANDSKDVYVTDLHGEYTVSVVAVNGNARTLRSFTFDGLDYKPYGTGTYSSDFFGSSWPVDIDYSEVGNRYRISSVWTDGYGFSFSPNGSNVTVYPSGAFETGYEYTGYGMVSVTDQGSTYDESTGTFTFNFKWTVSAGSFGPYSEYLVIDKK